MNLEYKTCNYSFFQQSQLIQCRMAHADSLIRCEKTTGKSYVILLLLLTSAFMTFEVINFCN